MVSIPQAIRYAFVMGAVIFFCRIFPFLILRGKAPTNEKRKARREALLNLVEKVAPPVAMTVLAVNALATPLLPAMSAANDAPDGAPALIAVGTLAAALVTALLHLWKRNALLSILCGTALYIAYLRLVVP
ncbi:MAG: AzlD domain-containing protein [Treponema sp.]|jgi:branched-subunit amino acid transport protein AzlD|nr:AzlD domain-containing protein [Treponema sp.]